MSVKEVAPANASPPPRGVSGGRAVALVIGSLVAVLSIVILVAGGTAAWFANQRDAHGSMMGGTATASTSTAALVSEPMTMGGTHGTRFDWAGDVRVSVQSTDGAPIFVGIARTDDAAAYLAGTAHDRMTVVGGDGPYDHGPRIRHRHVSGALRSLPPPADRGIWVVSAHGAGGQTISWDPGDGDWVLLIANENGGPGVHATADVGMRTPMFSWAAPVLTVVGVVLLGLAVLLIVLGARSRATE